MTSTGAAAVHVGHPGPRVPAGERVYVFGDVHGRLDLFEQLIGLVRRDSAGREPVRTSLIFLGDIVDRGPDSAELVRRCMSFAGRSERFVVLKGNHEAMMVHALAGDFSAFSLWLRNGGDAALVSWGLPADLVADGPSPALCRTARSAITTPVLNWLDALPLTRRVGDYLFVHAGIRPGTDIAEQREADLLWIRREFLESDASHPLMIVHGHSVTEKVTMQPNRIGIDTGAYHTGVLTALALEADRRWILATGGPTG